MIEAAQIDPSVQPTTIRETIARLRQNFARFPGARSVAGVLAATFEKWRERGFAGRSDAIARIATASGW